MAHKSALALTLSALFLALPARASSPMIAIDVGHSLQQPGAISARGKQEFEFNKDLAHVILRSIVSQGGQGFEIGADGKSVDPETRPLDAAARNAKFFLSVHHDSVQPQYLNDWTWQDGVQHYAEDRFAGFSLFVSRKNKQLAGSLQCASSIGRKLIEAGFKPSSHHAEKIPGEGREWADKANGVMYYDNLIVLKNARMPAVLLESGVIVNRDEELRMQDPAVRSRIGNAVASGLSKCGMLR
ncbi:MAG TPA: N-acetylmuramoyl-L-alanine amidase [Burkholderiaceae bacterium]